ncbi:hypothetical protein PANT111_130437 [Pantoea brenneri]|uniref:Ricin B lectin domain-containing protein n=1 Tax=Pantoea brenneri TaxID=472694 RepID=A0AAX3J2R4_9GAMM|nr:hypothetical protein PANT111_130437 [Pantoea brenneri]
MENQARSLPDRAWPCRRPRSARQAGCELLARLKHSEISLVNCNGKEQLWQTNPLSNCTMAT